MHTRTLTRRPRTRRAHPGNPARPRRALTSRARWIGLLAALIAFVAMSAPSAMAAPSAHAPTITEHPDGIGAFYPTVGPDGNIWTVAGGNIVRILSHAPYTATTFPVAGDDHYISDIITGPDGNLWFTDEGEWGDPPGMVGRILTHAPYTITEFTVEPTGNPFPYQIITGPDRNLYIAASCDNGWPGQPSCPGNSGGSVDRITPFGSNAKIQASVRHVAKTPSCTTDPTNQYPYLTCGTRLTGITVGPDRNLWLATQNNIDRLTLRGYHLTQYPIPDGAGALQITSGSDGNLWFTSGRNGSTIGRISSRNPRKISVYPTPTINSNSEPIGITTGPDGNLWYAELFGAVGTFSPRTPTKITQYTVPSGDHPFGVTDGPCDNTVWFTVNAAVGRIQLPGREGAKDLRQCRDDRGHALASHA